MKEVGIIPVKSMTNYKGTSAHYYILNDNVVELYEESIGNGKQYTLTKLNLNSLEDQQLANILRNEIEVHNTHSDLNQRIVNQLRNNYPYQTLNNDIQIGDKLDVFIMETVPLPTILFSIKK